MSIISKLSFVMRNICVIFIPLYFFSIESNADNFVLSIKCNGNEFHKQTKGDGEHRSNQNYSSRFYNLYDDHIDINTDGFVSIIEKKDTLSIQNSVNYGRWIINEARINIEVTKITSSESLNIFKASSHEIIIDRINGTVNENIDFSSGKGSNSEYNEYVYVGNCIKSSIKNKF